MILKSVPAAGATAAAARAREWHPALKESQDENKIVTTTIQSRHDQKLKENIQYLAGEEDVFSRDEPESIFVLREFCFRSSNSRDQVCLQIQCHSKLRP